MSGFDLHVHSTRSDGAVDPSAIPALARDAGLDGFVLSDHDTIEGYDAAKVAGDAIGIEVLRGVELSSHIGKAGVHVLGYFVRADDAALNDQLALLKDDRVFRAQEMVKKLNGLGVDVTFERVREIAQGNIARPHVAQAMVEAGVIKTTPEAFTEEWIGDGGRAYVDKPAPTPQEAIALIAGAGGVAVVAHPIWIANEGITPEDLVESLASAGLTGLEVRHPDHDEAMRERFGALADRLGLVQTGSSDWHGNAHGGMLGENTTDRETVERLRERAGR